MTSVYRLVVTCDENLSDKCVGLVEYSGRDRHALRHRTQIEANDKRSWVQGFNAQGTYDICPACRPAVEARLSAEKTPTP